jgi:hypothetical protein
MNRAHAEALCKLASEIKKFHNCGNPMCKIALRDGCVVWHNIDPFKRKLLEIKYKEKNDKQRTP